MLLLEGSICWPVGCTVSCSVFAAESKTDFKSDFTPICARPQMPPDLSAAWVQAAWVIVGGGALSNHDWMTSVILKHCLIWIRCLREFDLSKKNLHIISSNSTDNYYISWLDKYVFLSSENISAKIWKIPGACSCLDCGLTAAGLLLAIPVLHAVFHMLA